jgi:AcrR family transcriptional regulator
MSHRPEPKSHRHGSPDERRKRTHEALLEAALDLVDGERSFTTLSLREVTKAAGVVPAAFYRHYGSMEALGLELVAVSFKSLQSLMRDARVTPLPSHQLMRRSVEIYVHYVRDHRKHFQFISKERFSGNSNLRYAIRSEIRLFVSDLATDLSMLLRGRIIAPDDLRMMAGLIVNTMAAVTDEILDLPDDPRVEQELINRCERQLRVIFLGIGSWQTVPPA